MKLEELAPPLNEAATHTAEIRSQVLRRAVDGRRQRRHPLRWAIATAIPAAVVGAVLIWPVAHEDPLTGAEARVQLDRLAATAEGIRPAPDGAPVIHQVSVEQQVTPASEIDNHTSKYEVWATDDWTYRRTTNAKTGKLIEILKYKTEFSDTDVPLDANERRAYVDDHTKDGNDKTDSVWQFFEIRSVGGAFGPRTTMAAIDVLKSDEGVTVELKDGMTIATLEDSRGTRSMSFRTAEAELASISHEGSNGFRYTLDVEERDYVEAVPSEVLDTCEGKDQAAPGSMITCASNSIGSAVDPKYLSRNSDVLLVDTVPFGDWYAGVWEDPRIARAINEALGGDRSASKDLGDGLWQLHIDDYRVYYTLESMDPTTPAATLTLFVGGVASSEAADIAEARKMDDETRAAWADLGR